MSEYEQLREDIAELRELVLAIAAMTGFAHPDEKQREMWAEEMRMPPFPWDVKR